jgi:enamine deaminase RidA (YjgF/YER057c/UK114 family)
MLRAGEAPRPRGSAEPTRRDGGADRGIIVMASRPPGRKPPHRRPPRNGAAQRAAAPPPQRPEAPSMRRRLALLGYKLPEVKAPAFKYVPVVVHGGLAYVSGQVPWAGGEIMSPGKVDREVSIEQAQEAARACVLQALAWLDQTLSGLDEVERAVRMTAYVASSPGFGEQPAVADAASEVLLKIFGHAGQHTRAAIGVAELPRNAPVEIEFVFALKRPGGPPQRPRGFPVVEKRR